MTATPNAQTTESSTQSNPAAIERFPLSPIVRVTLLSLYIALTIPLPFLATATQAPVPANWLWVGIAMGAIVLFGALSERVQVDDDGIQVQYPRWVLFRSGWQVKWAEITALKARTTGQGGLVYYILTQTGQGYLLPMRIAGFTRLVNRLQAKTGIDTQDVRPLAQPWMYLVLFTFTVMLLLIDVWTINASRSLV
jgi:hypothetical protein